VRIRAGVAKARGGGVDQSRITGVQVVPAVAELFHRAGPEIFDDGISLVEQALENVAIGGRLEIEDDRFLAAIDRGEISRLAVLERAVLARVVTRLGRLDLDHARAQLGHQQRAVRPRENARQIDDGDAGKRPSLWHTLNSSSMWARGDSPDRRNPAIAQPIAFGMKWTPERSLKCPSQVRRSAPRANAVA
jgi:hypothetical protein